MDPAVVVREWGEPGWEPASWGAFAWLDLSPPIMAIMDTFR